MAIDLNLGGVKRPEWSLLPEGDYTMVLADCVEKPSAKNPETKVAHCTYEVVGNADDDLNGKKVMYFQVLNPPEGKNYDLQMGFLKVWLESLIGEPLDGDVSLELDDLVGRHVECHVIQEPDNRDKTKTVNSIQSFVLPFETE